ncbi:hypothetical protein M404DRAFT_994443 [Pisolithus tinctorius Marx 270]|uniref:Uncharacterized protein n=1 Tax=Pisolithus tinctorius Marx 270 TaxID=870435 RepID=A0A0C3JRI4_PISTI|nr:hypothetical protein M404DRAFT_994443 [Pisolithus tinctorius Marx 270]
MSVEVTIANASLRKRITDSADIKITRTSQLYCFGSVGTDSNGCKSNCSSASVASKEESRLFSGVSDNRTLSDTIN